MDKTSAGAVLLQALSSGDAVILGVALRDVRSGFAAITRAESMPAPAPAPESIGAIGKTKVGTAAAAAEDELTATAFAFAFAFALGGAADDDGCADGGAASTSCLLCFGAIVGVFEEAV